MSDSQGCAIANTIPLRLVTSQAKPTLVIGHHLLEGKIANLPKPLAVLFRSSAADRRSPSPLETAQAEDAQMEAAGLEKATGVSGWDVMAVVKRKIVFLNRPMPIVGGTAAGASREDKAWLGGANCMK